MFLDFQCINFVSLHILKVGSFHAKKTPAERAYVSALCKILGSLHFQSSDQEAIKLMRRLLSSVIESVSAEKDLLKELKWMAERLSSADTHPDQTLLQDQANSIFGKFWSSENDACLMI